MRATGVDGRANRAAALMTSVPPFSDERPATVVPQVLASFAANGFSPVSVNWAHEIGAVAARYPEADVVAASTRTRPLFEGRYGPTLAALFDAAGDSRTIGICNADVLMLTSDIRRRLEREPGTFFTAHRLDIDTFGGSIVGVYRKGIDAVFFDRDRFRPLFEDSRLLSLQIGAPFWDLALPIVASFHGPVAFIDPPFLVHTLHDAHWNAGDVAAGARPALAAIIEHAERCADFRPRARYFLKLVDQHVGRDVAELSPHKVNKALAILNMWMVKLERTGTTRVNVAMAGELGPYARAQLRLALPDTSGKAQAGPVGVPPSLMSLWVMRQWMRAKLRQMKPRRQDREIAESFAAAEF
jgi:hypothetical protein